MTADNNETLHNPAPPPKKKNNQTNKDKKQIELD